MPVRLSEILSDQDSSFGSLLRRADLLSRLQQLLTGSVDPELATRFQVANIRDGRLILLTPSASWATRLRMQAPRLIDVLRKAGCEDVNRVDVRVTPLAGHEIVP